MSVHNNTGVFLINQVKLRQLVGSQDHGIMAVTASGFFSYTGNGGPTNEPYEETTTYTFDAWDSLPALTAQDVAGKTLAKPAAVVVHGQFGPGADRVFRRRQRVHDRAERRGR
ncbi:hypothetical protein LP419_09680 [Massilia sp. H-1]|nr:hypothetical protein LP419_09680 [Massilia sp. H-1]